MISSLFQSSANSAEKMEITPVMRRQLKQLLLQMKGKRMNATAMMLITGETIYRVAIEVVERAIHLLKKVIRRGARSYSSNGKTAALVGALNRVVDEYDNMIIKMDIKMHPKKAETLINDWLAKSTLKRVIPGGDEDDDLSNGTYIDVAEPTPEGSGVVEIFI